VPGVGEKTALGLLQGIGGLDAIYARLDEISVLEFRGAKKMAPKLEEHRDLAYLSYQLATIKTDVEMPLNISQLHNSPADEQGLATLFADMEFKTWVAESDKSNSPRGVERDSSAQAKPALPEVEIVPVDIVKDYETVLTEDQLSAWVERIKAADLIAVDTETTSLNYMVADLVGISIAVDAGQAAYIPFGHDYLGVPEQLSRDRVIAHLKPLLENPSIKKVGQNIKYDMSIFAQHGIALKGI
jgi:DNA polymerase-1